MAKEMPEDLLEAMQNLSSEDWDEVVNAWTKGEAELKRYEQEYYNQVSNMQLGNRTFGENKKLITPQERRMEMHKSYIQLANSKDPEFAKQQPEMVQEPMEPVEEPEPSAIQNDKDNLVSGFMRSFNMSRFREGKEDMEKDNR